MTEDGVCRECGEAFLLRKDGAVRLHGDCPGGGRPPVLSADQGRLHGDAEGGTAADQEQGGERTEELREVGETPADTVHFGNEGPQHDTDGIVNPDDKYQEGQHSDDKKVT